MKKSVIISGLMAGVILIILCGCNEEKDYVVEAEKLHLRIITILYRKHQMIMRIRWINIIMRMVEMVKDCI